MQVTGLERQVIGLNRSPNQHLNGFVCLAAFFTKRVMTQYVLD